tara:strand:+ start:2002 stop:2931 length:930 start_codon:yes stop_codon:yes gene_type:complete
VSALPNSANEFLHHLARSRAENTLESYNTFLRKFNSFLATRERGLDNFTPEDIYAYERSRADWSPTTTNLFLVIIKSFCKFRLARIPVGATTEEVRASLLEQNRLRLIQECPKHKVSRPLKRKAMTVLEVSRLLRDAKAMTRSYLWKRVWLMWYLGCRKSELQSLVLDDRTFDDKTGRLVVQTAKGQMVERERLLWAEPKVTVPLLCELRDGEFAMGTHRDTLNKMLFYITQGKYDIPVTPHTARHTFITRMQETLVDDPSNILIKRLAGHSAGDITALYTSFTEERVRAAMTKEHYMLGLAPHVREWL